MRRGAGPPGGKAIGGRSRDRALGPAPYLPDPARELARHRHVGHARPLAGGAQRLVPAAEPGGRLVAPALDRGRHGGAPRRPLRLRRAGLEVPRRLDQRPPRGGVAGLGDAAPRVCRPPAPQTARVRHLSAPQTARVCRPSAPQTARVRHPSARPPPPRRMRSGASRLVITASATCRVRNVRTGACISRVQ